MPVGEGSIKRAAGKAEGRKCTELGLHSFEHPAP